MVELLYKCCVTKWLLGDAPKEPYEQSLLSDRLRKQAKAHRLGKPHRPKRVCRGSTASITLQAPWTQMLLASAAAYMDEERTEEEQEYDKQEEPLAGEHEGAEAHDQEGADDGRDHVHHDYGGDHVHEDVGFQISIPAGSPSGMISFSPTSARQFPSPYHAGTSSEPQFFPEQPTEFIPQS
ncbi:hypothetical protein PIB30_033083 [Stylosanthes scabra]|uniref:Uncharacterized protein n=1 Tax=Stylosanthes scabra TaxID=79078 RepID=A0ABU6QCL4_9FABA|nr:hypothetical protein [Stylosanthes scabra]